MSKSLFSCLTPPLQNTGRAPGPPSSSAGPRTAGAIDELSAEQQRQLRQQARRLLRRHGWPPVAQALRALCEQAARGYAQEPPLAALWQARADALVPPGRDGQGPAPKP